MKTIHELAEELNSNSTSSRQICLECLKAAEEKENTINAFLHLDKDDILSQADASDRRRAEGKASSRYDGIPVAIKDNIAVKGQPCTCASRILEPFVSPYDATVVKHLKDAGIVVFGRTNMDEFAMGSSCENSAYKSTRNPWDTSCVPGGSSGGSAAAVAAGEIPAALGSDTGGSIRQPASFCGVVGMKPTYGMVSRYGLVAFASSLDQIGPLTKDVRDSAILLDIISGHDPKDSTSLPQNQKVANLAKAIDELSSLQGVRIGVTKEYMEGEGLDNEVRELVMKSLEKLETLGADLVEVSLPHTSYAVATYYVIATAEASANLARFDGIRYGRRAESTADITELYLHSRGEGFGKEVKRRILLGTFVLSSGYYDAYYLRAQKVRTLLCRDFDDAFQKCDLLAGPTAPAPAFKIGERLQDPIQMYLSDIFTISLNLAGGCGISIPAGNHSSGLPVGIQLMGPPMGEKKLLQVASQLEYN